MKKIPPFKLAPEPLSAEAASLPKFEWADEDIGDRHRLTGTPDFLQEEDWPNCRLCCERMTLLCAARLDKS